jgi:hypothetical protein
MGTDKSYKDISHKKFNDNHKAIPIPSYIEYIVLIADIVDRGEILLHLGKIPPLRLRGNMIPSF